MSRPQKKRARLKRSRENLWKGINVLVNKAVLTEREAAKQSNAASSHEAEATEKGQATLEACSTKDKGEASARKVDDMPELESIVCKQSSTTKYASSGTSSTKKRQNEEKVDPEKKKVNGEKCRPSDLWVVNPKNGPRSSGSAPQNKKDAAQ